METNLSRKVAGIIRQKRKVAMSAVPTVTPTVTPCWAWTPKTKQQRSMLTRLELPPSPVGRGNRWHGDRHFSAHLSFTGFKLKVGLT